MRCMHVPCTYNILVTHSRRWYIYEGKRVMIAYMKRFTVHCFRGWYWAVQRKLASQCLEMAYLGLG